MASPEVLSPADDVYHINKHDFKVPFVCGRMNYYEDAKLIAELSADLGEAMVGINEQETELSDK